MAAKYRYDYVPWNLHPKTKSRLTKMKKKIDKIVGMKLTQDELITEILKHEVLLIEVINDSYVRPDTGKGQSSSKISEEEEIGLEMQARFEK